MLGERFARPSFETLLGRIIARDETVLPAFYELTVDQVYALVQGIVCSQADSQALVCDIYLHVWTCASASALDARRADIGWLLEVARAHAESWVLQQVSGKPLDGLPQYSQAAIAQGEGAAIPAS